MWEHVLENLLGSSFLVELSTCFPFLWLRSGFLTSRRDVETVELSFMYHLALELALCFLRQVTGKRLVWGCGRLNEGTNHGDFQWGANS